MRHRSTPLTASDGGHAAPASPGAGLAPAPFPLLALAAAVALVIAGPTGLAGQKGDDGDGARPDLSPPGTQPILREIAEAPSAERIEDDLRTLVGFGTRHTLSDTLSDERGIGAGRRWIKAEFERISET